MECRPKLLFGYTLKTEYWRLTVFTFIFVSQFWSLIFSSNFRHSVIGYHKKGFSIKWRHVAKIKKLLPSLKHSPNAAKIFQKQNLKVCWYFSGKDECCDRIFPFYFYFSHQIIESELSMSSMHCASRTTSVNFWFSQYLSSSPGEKSACTRPDQILWSSLEVGRSRSFPRYFSFPWLQLKLIEVAVQNWNSTNLMMAKVWVKVRDIFIGKILTKYLVSELCSQFFCICLLYILIFYKL
jgi:hypothetical protein